MMVSSVLAYQCINSSQSCSNSVVNLSIYEMVKQREITV